MPAVLYSRPGRKYDRARVRGAGLTQEGIPSIMADVRCGLIGYGAWGQHHARAIRAAGGAAHGAVLAAVCARSAESQAKARADHPDARIYADHREMLAKEELDLCYVVLPSDLHFPV